MKMCDVYSSSGDPSNLLLVDPETEQVINGEWPLSWARRRDIPIEKIGQIEHRGDYNETLARFERERGGFVAPVE